jgi:hypothetical protein
MNRDLINETSPNWCYPETIWTQVRFDECVDVARRIEQLLNFTYGPKQVLVIVAGLPGSGKTTFCDDLDRISELDLNWWVTRIDQAEYFSRADLSIADHRMTDARRWTLEELKRGIAESNDVILLECINLVEFEFQKYIDEAWKQKIPSLCVHFVCDDEEEARKMANRASWSVPSNVLRDWYSAYTYYPFGCATKGVIPIAARQLK